MPLDDAWNQYLVASTADGKLRQITDLEKNALSLRALFLVVGWKWVLPRGRSDADIVQMDGF